MPASGREASERVADAPGPLFAIAVCTYNRAEVVRECLESLMALEEPRDGHEILIVDNNSSDHTRDVVEGFMEASPNLRYVFESAQGISHARNAAWRAARGEYVAYFDDECLVEPNYLTVAQRIVDEHAPQVFGGLVRPRFATPPPRWYLDRFGGNQDLGGQARYLEPDEFIAGPNMVFRRRLLEELGGFDPSLGMVGNVVRLGEETDMQLRYRAEHPDGGILYDPALEVSHLERGDKFQLRYVLVYRVRSGVATARMRRDRIPTHLPRPVLAAGACGLILYQALSVLLSATIGMVVRSRRRYPYPGSYVYERVFGRAERLATFVTILGDLVHRRLDDVAPRGRRAAATEEAASPVRREDLGQPGATG